MPVISWISRAHTRVTYGKPESQNQAEQLASIVLGRDMCEFLQRGEKSLNAAQKALAYADTKHKSADGEMIFDRQQVRLMAPVPRPGALVSAGKNFSDHVAEMASKKGPAAPVAFLKLPGTVIGPKTISPIRRK